MNVKTQRKTCLKQQNIVEFIFKTTVKKTAFFTGVTKVV